MPSTLTPEQRQHSVALYIIIGAALFAFIKTFQLLSPILLSLLLVLLISLAVNPIVSWIRVSNQIAEESNLGGDSEPVLKIKEPEPQSDDKPGALRAGPGKMVKEVLGSFIAVAFNGAQILVVLITVFFGVVFMLRKHFIPTVTDADLYHLAGIVLHEKRSEGNKNNATS